MSIELLRANLSAKQDWINKKYNAYEIKNQRFDPSPVIPGREKVNYDSKLGWCAAAVDNLANRLNLDVFENDNFGMWDIYKLNNPDVLFDNAIRSALISACSFIYVSKNIDDEICLQVIGGKNATGRMNDVTRMLEEGYAILDRDEYGYPTIEAYFTPSYTQYFYLKNGSVLKTETVPNPSGYTLLIPIVYRPDENRPFGQSRISKDMIDLQDKARFTITCMEVAREFGAFPQKYVVGLSQDAEFDSLKNAYKQMLAIDKDMDGDKPTIGQFAQISLSSYISQLEHYRSEFNKASGLDDPKALEIVAVKAQKTFSAGFINAGLVSACMRDERHYKRSEIYETKLIWEPVYSIDNSVISTFGDGILKINQAIPNAISAKAIRQLTGLPIEVDE